MDLSKVSNIVFSDVDEYDYPDFADMWASNADYDGIPMTEDQIEELNNNYGDFVYEKLLEHLY